LTLREEWRLRVFESRVLRRIFGPKRDEVTGEWRRLHNKELDAVYSSLNIQVIKSRRLRWAGHVVHKEERRVGYRVPVEKLARRRPLGRPRHRLEYNIKMDLREVRLGDMFWIDLAQDRERWQAVLNVAMNFRVP
jgi:hypothetical protein